MILDKCIIQQTCKNWLLTCVSTLALSISVFASAIKPLMAQPVLRNELSRDQFFTTNFIFLLACVLFIIWPTNMRIDLYNLFNAAGLHQRRSYSLLHSETHPLHCLNANGCGPQLEINKMAKQLYKHGKQTATTWVNIHYNKMLVYSQIRQIKCMTAFKCYFSGISESFSYFDFYLYSFNGIFYLKKPSLWRESVYPSADIIKCYCGTALCNQHS